MPVKTTDKTISSPKRNQRHLSVCWWVAGMGVALVLGVLAGWGRYWYGYFVLGQGTLVGLLIPWAATLFCPGTSHHGNTMKHPGAFKVALILFMGFMISQAIGFGMAQPWFDPLGWLGRIVRQETRETVWGISLLGGAAARNFHLGVNGGFWIFLNLFDLSFMGFFLLVGINRQPEETKHG
jgi:hypothetical protein